MVQRRLDVVHRAAEPPGGPRDAAGGVEHAVVGRAPDQADVEDHGAPKLILVFDRPTLQRLVVTVAVCFGEAAQPAALEIRLGGRPGERHGRRMATASITNVTRSATRTVPPGPPRYGRIPKSVCLAVNVAFARRVSGPMRTCTTSGTSRV